MKAAGVRQEIASILGTNGYIWVYKSDGARDAFGKQQRPQELMRVTKEERMCMAVLKNSITCLEDQGLPVFRETIERALERYYENEAVVGEAKEMLRSADKKELLCESARAFVEQEIEGSQKALDLKRLAEEMEAQTATEFGLHQNK